MLLGIGKTVERVEKKRCTKSRKLRSGVVQYAYTICTPRDICCRTGTVRFLSYERNRVSTYSINIKREESSELYSTPESVPW